MVVRLFQRRPKLSWETHQLIWRLFADGEPVSEVVRRTGASSTFLYRLVADAGGVFKCAEYSGRFLSSSERWEIARLNDAGLGVREIARRTGRNASTISRELRRNVHQHSGRYHPGHAHMLAHRRQRRPKPRKLAQHERLRQEVQRRLRLRHSPEQIAGRLAVDYPDDERMRISHEAIYQAIYCKPVGELDRLLRADLRRRKAGPRRPRGRRRRGGGIVDAVPISQRPAEVDERVMPGHHEGDLIVGPRGSGSAIGTIVERVTGYTTLVPLPEGRSSQHVTDQLVATLGALPATLAKTLTWDRGTEMAQHLELTARTGIKVYFADPHTPWQRATNENTNGLLREYFPKGTDLSVHSAEHLQFVQDQLNDRPRKRLGYRTPREAIATLLEKGVATTP